MQHNCNIILAAHLKMSCQQVGMTRAGRTRGTLSTSKPLSVKCLHNQLWFKIFLQAIEKLHWKNSHAKTARPCCGSLHCQYKLPDLRTAYLHQITRVDSNTGLIFQYGTYAVQKKTFTVAINHQSITDPLRHANTFEFFAKTTKLQLI